MGAPSTWTTLRIEDLPGREQRRSRRPHPQPGPRGGGRGVGAGPRSWQRDRKSTRLNSSHSQISYADFCLKKKKKNKNDFFIHKKKTKNRHIKQIQNTA